MIKFPNERFLIFVIESEPLAHETSIVYKDSILFSSHLHLMLQIFIILYLPSDYTYLS